MVRHYYEEIELQWWREAEKKRLEQSQTANKQSCPLSVSDLTLERTRRDSEEKDEEEITFQRKSEGSSSKMESDFEQEDERKPPAREKISQLEETGQKRKTHPGELDSEDEEDEIYDKFQWRREFDGMFEDGGMDGIMFKEQPMFDKAYKAQQRIKEHTAMI